MREGDWVTGRVGEGVSSDIVKKTIFSDIYRLNEQSKITDHEKMES
jgi:predicted SnoaL-like aldol condensation-catalyzing enzyme